MKKIFSFLVILSMVTSTVGAFPLTANAVTKINICHKTGNGYKFMNTPAGPSLGGHLGHGDFLYTGPEGQGNDAWCQAHVPEVIDVCPNEVGVQATIPQGEQIVEGQCVPIPQGCNANATQTIVSDSTTKIGASYAVALTVIHPEWTASIPDATWIWATDPVESPTNDADLTKVFTKTFSIVGTPTAGLLDIAADNNYSVKVNGHDVSVAFDQNNFQLATQDQYDITSMLVGGLNTIEITATNWEIGQDANPAANPAGLLYKVTINNNECVTPEEPHTNDTAHIIATKIVCDAEQYLPNWGNGAPDINATTASAFVAASNGKCHLQSGWQFQWVTDAQSNVNPGDNALGLAPAPWTTFAGLTDSNGTVSAYVPAGGKVWVREVLKDGYVPFSFPSSPNNSNAVSAELYCHTDVLNYDNWDWIEPVAPNGTYYCVAFNAPKLPENTCVLPASSQGAGTIALQISGETPLQTVLSNAGYLLNATTDQTNTEQWNGTGNTVNFKVKFLSSITAGTHVFGYYTNNDLSTFQPLFANTAGHPDYPLAPVGTAGSSEYTFSVPNATTVGFAISMYYGNATTTYATKNSLNAGSEDHAVTYNPASNDYVVAFEDLPLAGADKDYNDMVVDVKVTGCQDGVQTSTVTLCKLDDSQHPLSGWTLMLKGASVQTGLLVPSNISSGVPSANLVGGVSYIAKSMGTWMNQGGANPVDTEYSTTDGWTTHMDGYTGYSTDILELQINNAFDPNSNWGTYNSAHTYAQSFTPAVSGASNFRIFDGNGTTQEEGWFGDNNGSLSVDINQGYAGITGQNGCIAFPNVPYGTYSADEIMQDGWTNVSGLGSVTVDSPTETFTIVNKHNQCEPVVEGSGWYGTYYNYASTTVGMNLPDAQWGNSYGDPLNVSSDSHDWYDAPFARFAQVDGSLMFGDNFFPFDSVPEESTNGHDYHLGAHWAAQVTSLAGGDYSYTLSSDDDTWVYVNGVLVVDNSGVHATGLSGSAPATIHLNAGANIVDIYFAERHIVGSYMDFKFNSELLDIKPYNPICEPIVPPVVDTDVCLNIDGTQTVAPVGLQVTAGFQCVPVDNGGPQACVAGAYTDDSNNSAAIRFEADQAYALGNINGQNGWSATGAYDFAIVPNTYGYSSFNSQSFRISDAVTSGSFGDWVFAPGVANGAGDSSATAGTFSAGTRQTHFEAQFDIASTRPCETQTGLHISVSPDRGDGSRMSYLRFEDTPAGLDVYFDDVTGTGPVSFNELLVADNLSRAIPHKVKFVMDFVDGPSNDVVEIYIDGVLVHTGTSWENYYRFSSEANAEQSPRFVKTLIFQARGTANPANLGKGFLIDNLTYGTSVPVEPSPEKKITSTDNNGGGGNGPIIFGFFGGGGNGAPQGQVLGEVLGDSCGLYMDKHIKLGSPKNDKDQVKKLQEFLNKWMNTTLPLTGFYGQLTYNAVLKFQQKYADSILKPWGLTGPTGLVYLATLTEINNLECPDLMLPLPTLVPWSANPKAQ